jgi:hypothetical protein
VGASAGGVCGAAGGVSGAVAAGGASGVVVAGGVSGACDNATPAKQRSITAELLSRSKRLLRMDMTRR